MDRIDEYRNIIKSKLDEYAEFSQVNDSIKNLVIVSQDQNHFLLLNEGWLDKKHIHNCLFHGEIKNEKIWIYFDGFEETITESLIASGIPQEQIVLAFHPPYIRSKTKFAVA
ncbi:MAG: XisI protein [Gomphosphaeria aponina SAG 52.96 = DSM 107014]|uniref:XisI protein n=1 Tax=Gomphosphaeria aponina SAG 52.96 = DSM 107014 TaxID=1521640 RepID=A0A941GU79_9CHRO|nr:XisI protein [Gomphosphaeria aponina SAG 52.96 = DSM 107014]